MFRKLYELQEKEKQESFNDMTTHGQYLQSQNTFFNTTVPNIMPTASSFNAPNSYYSAIQSPSLVSPNNLPIQQSINTAFIPNTIPASLAQQQQVCQTSSIDQLIATKNPMNPIGCGWLYSPPTSGSPIPQLSQGTIGTNNGPLQFAMQRQQYQKYYWDLNQAKKQILIDKCKALKNCSNVGSDPFGSDCAFCQDIGQGIPINPSTGQPLYSDSPLTTCSPQSIILSSSNCPPPQPPVGPSTGGGSSGNICAPLANGQLTVPCYQQIIQQAGCTDNGALSIALSSGALPSDYMASARTLPSMALFNRSTQQPFNIDIIASGKASTTTALQEFNKLSSAIQNNGPTSALGASARDLCLQSGAINSFDFCSELQPTTPPPFDLSCLQKAFLQAGGQPNGRMFPTQNNIQSVYNSMAKWGDVLNYFNGLALASQGGQQQVVSDGFTDMIQTVRNSYVNQSTALTDFLGITPEQLPNRTPLAIGVECFWLQPINGLWPIYNVTIEPSYPVINSPQASVPQLPGLVNQSINFIALADIRTQNDTQVKIQMNIGNGPAQINLGTNTIDTSVTYPTDNSTTFAQNAPGTYTSTTCYQLSGAQPNILKTWWANSPPSAQFSMQLLPCQQSSPSSSPITTPTLTRELNAPFMAYEIDGNSSTIQDIRIPELFGQSTLGNSGIIIHGNTADKLKAPGTRGYLTFTQGNSYLENTYISFQAWQTMTFVFRLNTMPVNETLLDMGYPGTNSNFQIRLTPFNGSTANISFTGGLMSGKTGMQLQLSKWYMCVVSQVGGNGPTATAWTVSFMDLQNIVQGNVSNSWYNGNLTNGFTVGNGGKPLNGTLNAPSYIHLGGNLNNGTGTFSWDLAWWHFFVQAPDINTLQRDAENSWIWSLNT